MSLESRYEQLYREQNDVCGEPFQEFVAFAEAQLNSSATVLDLGCGQGRDAIVFAKRGMAVTGVDISATGVKQMLTFAAANKLPIAGVVADIREYRAEGRFDIIILDRTLHMLSNPDDRLGVIARCAGWLAKSGYLLIADEPSNIRAFADWIDADSHKWQVISKLKPGFYFVQLVSP